LTVIGGLLILVILVAQRISAEWGVQPQEILDQMSETPFRRRPPNSWVIGGRATRVRPPTPNALGTASVYLHEPNGSLEKGALALIQYQVMEDDSAARRAWEGSTAAMREPTAEGGPRRLFRVNGFHYSHLCVDESTGDLHYAYCQVLIGEVFYEAFDRSGKPGGCDCVVWMTKAAAEHLKHVEASIGLW
jgi:hypothetical protein